MSKFKNGDYVFIKECNTFGVVQEVESDGSISVKAIDDSAWYCDEEDLCQAAMTDDGPRIVNIDLVSGVTKE